MALEQADDWVLFADHAVEIGKHRFLGIIGIRLSELPPPGSSLKLSDMTPVALLPVEASNQETVHQQLETVVAETGIVLQAFLNGYCSSTSGRV